MDVRNSTEELCDLAALYTLGALDERDLEDYERHVVKCSTCHDELATFSLVAEELALLGAATPAPELRDRLLASIAPSPVVTDVQVWKNWSADALADDSMTVVRASSTDWETTGTPGISVRRLAVDPARQTATMLIRMEPGSSYAPHRHASGEECIVLEGDLHVGDDIVMGPGDYQRAPEGTVHPVQSTEGGCLLFIVSSLHDELVD